MPFVAIAIDPIATSQATSNWLRSSAASQSTVRCCTEWSLKPASAATMAKTTKVVRLFGCSRLILSFVSKRTISSIYSTSFGYVATCTQVFTIRHRAETVHSSIKRFQPLLDHNIDPMHWLTLLSLPSVQSRYFHFCLQIAPTPDLLYQFRSPLH